MKENISEAFVAVLLICSALIFLKPSILPESIDASVALACAGLFTIFAIFIWRERRGDERDTRLRNSVGRIGYLAGAFVLCLGILIQYIRQEMVDAWLFAALISMIAAKVVGLAWVKRKY